MDRYIRISVPVLVLKKLDITHTCAWSKCRFPIKVKVDAADILGYRSLFIMSKLSHSHCWPLDSCQGSFVRWFLGTFFHSKCRYHLWLSTERDFHIERGWEAFMLVTQVIYIYLHVRFFFFIYFIRLLNLLNTT